MINTKYNKLLDELKKYDKLAVAFSGGIDSTLLLKAAKDALENRVYAMTIKSEFIPASDVEDTKSLAAELGVEHIIIPFSPLEIPEIQTNPKDRCYHCKTAIFMRLLEECEIREIPQIVEGTNIDDLKDYRPGFKALQELEIKSPFLDVKLNKKEIREISKMLNLPNWNKPEAACLASRIPYGDEINADALKKVEQAEIILSSFGFTGVRVRLHNTVARIEIREEDFENFLQSRKRILYSLKNLEIPYIALDLEGYRKGSLNEVK